MAVCSRVVFVTSTCPHKKDFPRDVIERRVFFPPILLVLKYQCTIESCCVSPQLDSC